MSCDLYLWAAHSAYTWDELAEAICCSYIGINQILAKTDGECLVSGCRVVVGCTDLFLCTLYGLRLPALHRLATGASIPVVGT